MRGKDFSRQVGDLGLGSAGHPVDKLIGGVELEPPQDALAKRGPGAVAVEVKHAGLERPKADLVAAALVTEDVSPATELGGGAVGRLAEAAGAGAAEDEDAVERLALGVGREGGLEVVGGMDVTGLGPDLDGGL